MKRKTPPAVRSLADIDRLIRDMTLDQKVGQCMTLAFYGTVITDVELEQIENLHCGGLRITPHINTSDNKQFVRRLAPYYTPGQYAEVLNELQSIAASRPLGLPLHMSTDQEGDLSADILHGGINFFPSQMGLAATGSPALVQKAVCAMNRQLRAIGIHMAHSPVLDVNIKPKNPEIGCRSFSDSPEMCAEYGLAFLKGAREAGIISTGKHFPGRGDSEVDAHYTLPVLKASRARLDAVELLPYRKLIAAGLPAIMSAHNAYSALDDSGLPASLSRKILMGLLRGELGFKGVITSDAMAMKGVTAIAPEPEACAMAIAAGNDLVLVKSYNGTPQATFAAIKRFVQTGKIPEEQLNQSVRRILAMKLAYGIFAKRYTDPVDADCAVSDEKTIALSKETSRRCITVIRDTPRQLPLSPKKTTLVILPVRMEYHEKGNDFWYSPTSLYQQVRKFVPRAVLHEFAVPATPEAIRAAVKRSAGFDNVIVFDHLWRGPASSHELVKKLVAAKRKVTVVANNIYDDRFLKEAGTLVVTYNAMPPGMEAAAELLYGKRKSAGKSPLLK